MFIDKAATPQNSVYYFFKKNVYRTDCFIHNQLEKQVLVTHCGHLKVQEISKRYPDSINGMTTIYDTN